MNSRNRFSPGGEWLAGILAGFVLLVMGTPVEAQNPNLVSEAIAQGHGALAGAQPSLGVGAMGIQGTPGVTPIGVLGGLSSYRFPITGTGSALRFGGYGDPTGIGYAPGSVAFGTEGVAGGGNLYGPGATAAAPTVGGVTVIQGFPRTGYAPGSVAFGAVNVARGGAYGQRHFWPLTRSYAAPRTYGARPYPITAVPGPGGGAFGVTGFTGGTLENRSHFGPAPAGFSPSGRPASGYGRTYIFSR